MTATRPRPSVRPSPPRRPPVLAIAIGAVVLVFGVGLALALTGGDDGGAVADADLAAFAPVTVDGAALPTFADGEDDPAIGTTSPRLEGEAPDGTPVTVGGAGTGEVTLVAFLAHWCPHCQRELPLLVALSQQGAFDGVRTVAVLTGTNAQAPNYPPAEWLAREGWAGDELLDDEAVTAATAYGLAGYPYLVVLDANGDVAARSSGELSAEAVTALVDQAR